MNMTCQRVAEDLLRYRDGELSDDEAGHLRDHLHLCPPCLGLLRTYEEVVEVLRRLRPVKMPDGLLDRLKATMPREPGAEI